MALLNPTFILGLFVLLYLSSFVVFAVLRILTGVSIQRIGYLSLRRLAFTPRDGFKIEIRGLGLNVHRPTFAQPTWLSVVVHELVVTADLEELARGQGEEQGEEQKDESESGEAESEGEEEAVDAGQKEPEVPPIPSIRRERTPDRTPERPPSPTWRQLMRVKDRIKRLHRRVHWLRMVDVVATNSTVHVQGVGSLQVGSLTVAVDTRRKMVDRVRFFLQGRRKEEREERQAEWIVSVRSVLFTAGGGSSESVEVLDTATLNVHGFLYETLDGLRDVAVALKLGRVHIPWDDVGEGVRRYGEKKAESPRAETTPASPPLMQAVSDSREFVSSILRGIREVQFAISFIGFAKRVDTPKASVVLSASMKEVVVDLHRLDAKSPAHRMYFGSKDTAHEALAAALSISVGLDEGQGQPERLVYIPMATTTVRTTLPSKTVELADGVSPAERNANILFANSVVTSPSVDLDPRHLPLLLAAMAGRQQKKQHSQEQHYRFVSRLLPKANIKFSMHEPVLRIALPPTGSTDPDDSDLLISSISSISLDLESSHSAVEELHYSLASTVRTQTHRLYYQTAGGQRYELLDTDSFELKVSLDASPDVRVVASGVLQTFCVRLVRPEVSEGLRQIVRQVRETKKPRVEAVGGPSFLRALPPWLLHAQIQVSDFSAEVAGVDEAVSPDVRGVAVQLESWSAEYRAQRLGSGSLARRPSRRRAGSRTAVSPDPLELLRTPRKKHQHAGDGRRVAVHVRGLEAFVVEAADRWEVEPFVSVPRFEVAVSTLGDARGPVLHVHSHVRTLLVQYSLYRHYAVLVGLLVLRAAGGSTKSSTSSPPRPSTHLGIPGSEPTHSPSPPLLTVDFKASLVQVKADMPSDPPVMVQLYGIEAGRHRWSPPFAQSKLMRLYAEAPRMRRVWARMVSVKNGRVDWRESRRKTADKTQEERMLDVTADAVRLAVPHEMVVHRISDNVINVVKSAQQLHHRFRTGTDEYILDKHPEAARRVPKVSLRTRTLLVELEDGAFEWKLGMIYRAGRVEQMQRQAREEAFRVKVKKIHEEQARKESSRFRARSAVGQTRTRTSVSSARSSSEGRRQRGRTPRYDPDSGCVSGTAHVSIAEARHQLNLHNAQSWRQRIDGHYARSRDGMKAMRSQFWGRDEVPDDVDDSEQILEIPHRPALAAALVRDLRLVVDQPSFPLDELPDFLFRIGKGMPRDTRYSLLVPMNVRIDVGEARLSLRDYPLPLVHVPAIDAKQSSRLPALTLRTDFVMAEEFRGAESTRRIRVEVVRGTDGSTPLSIDVRRTIGPVKSYSDMAVDIHTAQPTRVTWGPSYQPAIQDMMMVIESFTKPQLDPSDTVGFWDKIRLNLHSRVRIAWRGDGDVHLALKGTRDPYQVQGNGAGFLMCWRGDVRWDVHPDDDPKRFMSVESAEYVLAVPRYGDESLPSGTLQKVAMKLSGRVRWLAGLVFERAIEGQRRRFDFRPHYDVVLKAPHRAKSEGGLLAYDAFRGFRSQHVHLSIAVQAPSDSTPESYNAVHLTPRLFTHFFAWWSLFSGPMSLPVRQGSLWPGREKNSKKFGRHLATIKYNLVLAPLYLSHIYKHREQQIEDETVAASSATGLKVRFDSFVLDLHQRREEFDTRDRGPKSHSRTSGMKIHAGQLDLVSADIRAVSAGRGNSPEDPQDPEASSEPDVHFSIPDNDTSWIDMDDFVELDWILPAEPSADTKILPLAYAPRITYFRQTDIGGVIAGDPQRTSPFGNEPTHPCVMSRDDDPRRVQAQLIRQRLRQLRQQIDTHTRHLNELELRLVVAGEHAEQETRDEFESLGRHISVLTERETFMAGMLKQMAGESGGGSETAGESGPGASETSIDLCDETMTIPSTAEFASDFKNRFVVHNMQLKWNNTLRNVVLRYIHQVSQRRGFVYYLSRPAVKFILDMVEEQGKSSKTETKSRTAPSGNGPTMEDRIRKMLQDGRKFVENDTSVRASMEDLCGGIADGFAPQSSYHVRLIAPQIQLQSDRNTKHVVLIAAKGMEMKAVEVMDRARVSDLVSGLVQRRMLVNMDSTQFFVTHQKWFSTQLVSMYSGSTYGTPEGSSWPPWVPMEVMFDFSTDPFGFKRVVQKTSATLRYDKFNNLRLKYNDEVEVEVEGEGKEGDEETEEEGEERMDNLWVEFPQARALCNSSQYYAMFVIVVDLLMYSEPLEKTRSERLEKIILASDFSDLRGAPEMVIRLQERVRQLEDIKSHFQAHSPHLLDRQAWRDRLALERDLAVCEDELFFMMKAITTSQRKYEGASSASPALLKWSISAREIVWHLIRDNHEPLVELQLKDVEYDRTDNLDGSHINLLQVGRILGLNLLPDAIYPTMVAPYADGTSSTGGQSSPMLRVYWNMLEAIAGIPVMDHFEVGLVPLKIQLERDLGKKLFEYIFPGIDGDPKNPIPGISVDDDLSLPDNASLGSSTDRPVTAGGETYRDDDSSSSRPGSLELRLRPTLNSDARGSPKQKALSVHSGDGGGSSSSSFRLFRPPATGTPKKKRSYGSLKSAATAAAASSGPVQPGVVRSSSAELKKTSRFGLRSRSGNYDTNINSSAGSDTRNTTSDDLTKMMARASSYMTFAYIKMPSVVLCLSYKGRGDRNLEDVHDFVFRLPTIEYRNKTWSNLDLALALKSRVIKALISHTGAIIGNKFSKHRPTTAQQTRLREIATSSVLLVTPQPDSRDNSGDDSSSLYGVSPVDFSRSPPRSVKGPSSQSSSIPIPRPSSRSSSIASSRSQLSGASQQQEKPQPPPVPGFLMMTTPTTPVSDIPPSSTRATDLLRPSSSSASKLFGGIASKNDNSNIPRPSTSASSLEAFGPEPEKRRRPTVGSVGGGSSGNGFLRDKFSAFTSRLRDRESPSTPGNAPKHVDNDKTPQQQDAEDESQDQPEAGIGRRLSRGPRSKSGF